MEPACPDPVTYCTAKASSVGCIAQIGTSGPSSAGGVEDLHIACSSVTNNKAGLMLWGRSAGAQPFFGGTLCMTPPVGRTPVQFSGGSPSGDDCTGSFDYTIDQAFLDSFAFSDGDPLFAQYWYRDPGFAPPNSAGLSDAVQVFVCP